MVDFTPIGSSIFFAGVEYRGALWSAMLVGGWGTTDPVCRTPVACVLPRGGLGFGVGESGSRGLGVGGGGGSWHAIL